MKTVKTSELTGAALDWAVAKCWYNDRHVELTEGKTGVRVLRDPSYSGTEHSHWFVFFASTDWSQGGPIIEREKISLLAFGLVDWKATFDYGGSSTSDQYGPTPLIAALRCYVTSKLGDNVEIPEELL
jgi:hypothetical protein